MTIKRIIESDLTKAILALALITGGLWFVASLIDSHYNVVEEKRDKSFQEARDACYARERSCDSIFDNLYDDLFPNQ